MRGRLWEWWVGQECRVHLPWEEGGHRSFRLQDWEHSTGLDSTAVPLQRCHDPVINLDGFLYKRETLLEYILHQKISGRWRPTRTAGHPAEEGSAAAATTRALLEKGSAMASRPSNASRPRLPGETTCRQGQALPSLWILSVTHPQGQGHQVGEAVQCCDLPSSGKLLCKSPWCAWAAHRSQAAWTACAFPRMSRDPRQPEQRYAAATVTLECAQRVIWKGMVDPMNRDKRVERGILVLQARVRGRPHTRAWMQVRRYPGMRLEPNCQSTNPGSLLSSLTKLPQSLFTLLSPSFKWGY